jgi:hypothetical protein
MSMLQGKAQAGDDPVTTRTQMSMIAAAALARRPAAHARHVADLM